MFGFHTQQPIAYFTLNKYCGICIFRKGKQKDHNCSKNWNQSAKAIEPEIAVNIVFFGQNWIKSGNYYWK
jgi:hypothetical protein